MKNNDDLLLSIANVLCIPKALIHLSDDQSFIVFVDNEWIHQLTKSGDVNECNSKENQRSLLLASSYPNETSLDGVTKLHISPCPESHLCENDLVTSKIVNCFGHEIDLLSKHSYFSTGKNTCLSYPNSYFEENLDTGYHRCKASQLEVRDDNEKSFEEVAYNEVSIINAARQSMHFNIFPTLAKLRISGSIFLVKRVMLHSVYDAVMYSPCRLATSNAKPLFLLFQLLKAFDFITENFSRTRLNQLSWKEIELSELLWIQADIKLKANASRSLSVKMVEEIVKSLPDVAVSEVFLKKMVDLWVHK